MPEFTTIASSLDESVNHVVPADDGGFFEARYVRRVPSRWICYLSSHSGCDKACRFCHLTATGQTMMKPATMETYLAQAEKVFGSYRIRLEGGAAPADKVHFNFMARGEPLENPVVLAQGDALFASLGAIAAQHGLIHAHKVSTILPKTLKHDLSTVLADPASQLYYSLYSVDAGFRKRWLPKALPVDEGLDLLSHYQRATGREFILHWAFIKGENDSQAHIEKLLDAVASRGLRAKFNLVRYNPHSGRHGVETDEVRLQALFDQVACALGSSGSRIVQRVGFDVKASCGMFVEPGTIAAQAA
jgi:23S rRNA (adenine2503-C2)-methyltransferase